jgi:chromosomal replication initiator protein
MTLPDQIRRIKLTVADHFGITVEDIDGRRRPDHIVFPRHVAMAFCVHMLRLKSYHVGELFDRHHTDVIHAVQRVTDRTSVYPAERDAVAAILKKLEQKEAT